MNLSEDAVMLGSEEVDMDDIRGSFIDKLGEMGIELSSASKSNNDEEDYNRRAFEKPISDKVKRYSKEKEQVNNIEEAEPICETPIKKND